MMLLKKLYGILVANVTNIDTSGFVLKTKYDTGKSGQKNKIPGTSGLVKKTDYNLKITEIENKIPRICGLATNAALTMVENKVPSINSFVKKADYNIKISEIEKKLADHDHKYITIDDKLRSLNQKINSKKTKHLLVENELKKLQTFNSIYFREKCHFEEDGAQNYLVFQPKYRYLKRVASLGSGNYIYFWKSKGLSDENITATTTTTITSVHS